MAEMMPKEEISYNVIEGVSAGGLNAAVLSTFEIGDEARAIDWLHSMWTTTIRATDLWDYWPTWLFGGLYRTGMLDTSKFRRVI